MTIAFDKTTGTYANGMRVGDFIGCSCDNDPEWATGFVCVPRGSARYGIYADWDTRSGPTWGYMPAENVYLKAPIEVLGDNDDDCI